MNKVHARRLLKLADFLEKVPRKRFDYGMYVGESWRGAQDLSCGTTACALGWAATMPAFRRLGVRFVDYDRTLRRQFGGIGLKWKRYSDEQGVSRHLFGLSYAEHDYLFVPGGDYGGSSGLMADATPKQVAAHIRKFVKRATESESEGSNG